jgi:hypothetical protein
MNFKKILPLAVVASLALPLVAMSSTTRPNLYINGAPVNSSGTTSDITADLQQTSTQNQVLPNQIENTKSTKWPANGGVGPVVLTSSQQSKIYGNTSQTTTASDTSASKTAANTASQMTPQECEAAAKFNASEQSALENVSVGTTGCRAALRATTSHTSVSKKAANSGSATTPTSSTKICTCDSVEVDPATGVATDCCGNVLGATTSHTSASKTAANSGSASTVSDSAVTTNLAASSDSDSTNYMYHGTLPQGGPGPAVVRTKS